MRVLSKIFFLGFMFSNLSSAETKVSWVQLYESLFSEKAPIDIKSTETKLEEKFRNAPNPLRSQLALLLMKLDEERSAPKGVWADWILDSSEVDRSVISQENRCSALLQSAAAHFLLKNFQESKLRYEKLISSENCTSDQRDFSEFQQGWILVNLNKSEAALKLWLTLLEKIEKRQDTSLNKLSIIKESATLSLALENNNDYRKLMTYVQSSQEKDALTEGGLNALSSLINHNRKFLDLKMKLTQDLEIDRLRRLFPSSKLSLLTTACQDLEWYPDSLDFALLENRVILCSQEISQSKRSTQKGLIYQLEKNLERFSGCASCSVEIAKLYAAIGEREKSCKATTSAGVITYSAQSLNVYCAAKLNTETYNQFFSELQKVDWSKVNSENLKAFSDFIRIKTQEVPFSNAYARFLSLFKNKKEYSVSFLALDYLKIEMSRNFLHHEILASYSSLNPIPLLQKDWDFISATYTLKELQLSKAPQSFSKLSEYIEKGCEECVMPYMQISFNSENIFQIWDRFLALPKGHQKQEIQSTLIQLSFDQLYQSKVTFKDLEEKFPEQSLLIKLNHVVEGKVDLDHLSKAEMSLFRIDQISALKQYLYVKKNLSEFLTQLENKKFSHLAGVAAFIKKTKVIFSLRSKLDANFTFFVQKVDEQTFSILRTYKAQIEDSPQDLKNFWGENPRIAQQVLALIAKWQSMLGRNSSS